MGKILSQRWLEHLDEGMLKDYLEESLPKLLTFFWCVVLALIIWFIGSNIIKMVRKGIRRSMERHGRDEGVCRFMDSLLNAVLYIVFLNLFGIETSSVAAAVASLGLTAGLALQGSLSNFAGGVLILILHPFRIGDYIIEDTHKNEGTVVDISIIYTKLKTVDNKIIVVPNGALATTSLTNATKSDKRLMNLVLPIGYQDDLKQAKSVLETIAFAIPERLPEEEVSVFVNALGIHSVELGMRFWVSTDDYWPVRWRTLEKIKFAFDEAGISIPYQQLDVHLKNVGE